MLRELRVKNLAVIESLTVPFGPGLNVLTGETGAGKSILIDALTLLLGERAQPAETIRTGAETAQRLAANTRGSASQVRPPSFDSVKQTSCSILLSTDRY